MYFRRIIGRVLRSISKTKIFKIPRLFLRAESLLAEIESKAEKFIPKVTLDIISDDDDNMVLELAHECLADFLITGNITDFTIHNYEQTKIVTPKEYWENYRPE